MSHSHPCTLCGNAGHQASRCKELGVPPDGFYKPSPGMHQGDDDCDDAIRGRAKRRRIDSITEYNIPLKYTYTSWLIPLLNSRKVATKRLF
jgi:hypothetical protein